MLRLVAALLSLATLVATPAGGDPARAVPTTWSVEGLQRLTDYFGSEVAGGRIPGAVVLIQQHGKPVYFESFGFRDPVAHAPMTADAIFRIYSMSKPITSVAVMMLVDDGKIALEDPLSKYIPSFAEVKVAASTEPSPGTAAIKLQPLQRPITILDLLRHSSGITYGFYGDTEVRQLYAKSELFAGDFDNAQFVERLAKLPLAEQPGSLWDYGHSTDVLGRVVEIVSGQSLYRFEKARLLDPLGMHDTAFFVAEAKRGRIAQFLPNDRFEQPVAGLDDPTRPRNWQSGGAGMDGTAGDYARFAQMLLEGGALEGRRYLKAETVRLMTSDQIGASRIGRDAYYFPGRDSGFGLGLAVRTAASGLLPAGEYGWDGVGGTFFFVDPGDDMLTVVMMQAPSQRGRIEQEVRELIYGALRK